MISHGTLDCPSQGPSPQRLATEYGPQPYGCGQPETEHTGIVELTKESRFNHLGAPWSTRVVGCYQKDILTFASSVKMQDVGGNANMGAN